MKNIRKCLLILLLITGCYCLQAQEIFLVKSQRSSIQGTSSLHDWGSSINTVNFRCVVRIEGSALKSINSIEVSIPVTSIKSTEGKTMDNKTYKTFQSDAHPVIIFTSANANVHGTPQNTVMETTGQLTMASVTNTVTLSAKGKVLANGDLQLSVSKKLKMTDYKMKPPVMMLGAIKVGNEITVDFDIILTRTK